MDRSNRVKISVFGSVISMNSADMMTIATFYLREIVCLIEKLLLCFTVRQEYDGRLSE